MDELITELRQLTAAINALVQINSQLLMVMAEVDANPDAQPSTYMDGTPCR